MEPLFTSWHFVKRTAIAIIPKQPFLDWVNKTEPDPAEHSDEPADWF